MNYKNVDASGTKGWIYVIGLRSLGIIVQMSAVLVGDKISTSFSGNCGDQHRSIAPAILVVVIGFVPSFYGTISIFQAKRYGLGVVSIVLGLISVVIGLIAIGIAAFQLCF